MTTPSEGVKEQEHQRVMAALSAIISWRDGSLYLTVANVLAQARREAWEEAAQVAETEFPGNGTHLTWREIAAALRDRARAQGGAR